MKKKINTSLILLGSVTLLIGCAQVKMPSINTPQPKKYGYVDNVMTANGFPKNTTQWVVYSDRSRNATYINKNDDKASKEIKFLEPLIVVRKKDGLLKVAEYIPDAFIKKVPSKSIKTYGWIREDQVLQWGNALRNYETGYAMKAAVVPSNSDVIENALNYYSNDSISVFTTPTLSEKASVKIPNGQLVYIYKQAENNKRYLIGKEPTINPDSVSKSVYGWVSSNVIEPWGGRSAIKLKASPKINDTLLGIYKGSTLKPQKKPVVTIKDLVNRSALENIFPVDISQKEKDTFTRTKFFTNVLDYSKNYVYNVVGEPIDFIRYKEIVAKSKKLNVVFALDVSYDNIPYTPVVKSLLQDLQLYFDKPSYFNTVKYGVVLYKNNLCGSNVAASSLTKNYNEVTQFIDSRINQMYCRETDGGPQPLAEGLIGAGNILSNATDETNIVIVVGTNADQSGNMMEVVNTLSRAQARLIMYQTHAKSSDSYNNFMLASEKIVSTTAKNISELKKQKIIDLNDVLRSNDFSLKESEAGFYSLDFPKESMSQGFVVFPKKGDVANPGMLKKAVDSLLQQVAYGNNVINNSLGGYFHSKVGVAKTELDLSYGYKFPGLLNPISTDIAEQLVNQEQPFLTTGYISPKLINDYGSELEKGILISDEEYDNLSLFYKEVYEKSGAAKSNFNQKNAIKAFIKLVKKYNPTIKRYEKGNLLKQPMAFSVGLTTGFDTTDDELMLADNLKNWKNSKVMDPLTVQNYFRQYNVLVDRLLAYRNDPIIKVKHNGQEFYWLNEYFMPTFMAINKPKN